MSKNVYDTEPSTDYDTKMVAIRGEKGDTIKTESGRRLEILQRKQPYHGPSFFCEDENGDRLKITFPGPYHGMQVWEAVTDDVGGVTAWQKAEDTAGELDEVKRHAICDMCGEPLKTADHRRKNVLRIEH